VPGVVNKRTSRWPRAPNLIYKDRSPRHPDLEGRPQFKVDPGRWFKMESETVGLWNELRQGRLALLGDHHVLRYEAIINAEQSAPVSYGI
jgi:hypothetical protein